MAGFLVRKGGGKARRKARRPYATRKPRAYEAKELGDLVQIDTLQVVLVPLARVTPLGRTLWAKHREEMVRRSPYPIRAVQVDGGSEFMAEFEGTCFRLGIKLFVLPPRSPKLNGYVERMQRTLRGAFPLGKHRVEFYTRPLPHGVAAMQQELERYLDYYNIRRPHMALGGLAPMECLDKLRQGGPQESQMS